MHALVAKDGWLEFNVPFQTLVAKI